MGIVIVTARLELSLRFFMATVQQFPPALAFGAAFGRLQTVNGREAFDGSDETAITVRHRSKLPIVRRD